jgi:hypothetical protein
LPYGFHANTWLIPPIYLDSATKCPALPRMRVGVEMGVAVGVMENMSEDGGQKSFLFWLECHAKLRKNG